MALALVSAVTCLSAVLQTPSRSHSCHGMMMEPPSGPHFSGVVSEQRDCCLMQAADLAGTARASLSAPALVVVAHVEVEPLSRATAVHVGAFDPGVPIGSPPPPYFLGSAFLV